MSPNTEAERRAVAMEQMAQHIAGLLPHNVIDAHTVLRTVARHVATFPLTPPDHEGEQRLLKAPADDVLSFVARKTPKKKGGGFDYWTAEPSRNYSEDCEVGGILAEEYLAFIGQYPTVGNSTLLGCVVNAMVNKVVARGPGSRTEYRLSGVEVQFLQRINEYAMALAAAALGRVPAPEAHQ